MRAMAVTRPAARQLDAIDLEIPIPGPSEILVRVLACGVCRTDLHVVDGELPNATIPSFRDTRSSAVWNGAAIASPDSRWARESAFFG